MTFQIIKAQDICINEEFLFLPALTCHQQLILMEAICTYEKQ